MQWSLGFAFCNKQIKAEKTRIEGQVCRFGCFVRKVLSIAFVTVMHIFCHAIKKMQE